MVHFAAQDLPQNRVEGSSRITLYGSTSEHWRQRFGFA
ncbi:hypothetical protein APY03_0402 [Variovorax sp. WDL1]|nr:hypothetical protein APY03_0402 [Variovorax sp. WDL1]